MGDLYLMKQIVNSEEYYIPSIKATNSSNQLMPHDVHSGSTMIIPLQPEIIINIYYNNQLVASSTSDHQPITINCTSNIKSNDEVYFIISGPHGSMDFY